MYYGNKKIKDVYFGGVPIKEAYSGSTLVWRKATTNPIMPVYVDMGLSVQWGNCNIGTTNPDSFGTEYLLSTFIDTNFPQFYDPIELLVNPGPITYVTRRIPSKTEWQELVDNCNIKTIIYTQMSEFSGDTWVTSASLLFTSLITGNSIELPTYSYKKDYNPYTYIGYITNSISSPGEVKYGQTFQAVVRGDSNYEIEFGSYPSSYQDPVFIRPVFEVKSLQ